MDESATSNKWLQRSGIRLIYLRFNLRLLNCHGGALSLST
jgi:hypothetical protein